MRRGTKRRLTCAMVIGVCATAATTAAAQVPRTVPRRPAAPVESLDAQLYRATRQGDLVAVRKLLDLGAPVNVPDGQRSPLMIAAIKNRPGLVELLASRGADLEARDGSGHTALWSSCWAEADEAFEKLLDLGADPRTTDASGEPLFVRAAGLGRAKVVSALLDKGVEVDARARTGAATGFTGLLRAAGAGNVEMVEMLLARGADMLLRTAAGDTVLSQAVASGRRELVETFLSRGMDINSADERGRTPLMIAGMTGNARVVRLLLSRGADALRKDKSGETALTLANGEARVAIELWAGEHLPR